MVKATRAIDDGLGNRRTRECANGHKIVSIEIRREVASACKVRRSEEVLSARKRAELYARDMRIIRDLSHMRKVDAARKYGLSKSSITLIERRRQGGK